MQKDPASKETKDHEETSSKTLHEINEDQQTADVGNDSTSTPSPDGAVDESDEIKDAGPM